MSGKQSAFSENAERRASVVVVILALVALAAVLLGRPSADMLPLFLFYTVNLAHTYYSVRCFSSIISPKLRSQRIVDAVLFVLYVLLAFQLSDPLRFYLIASLLYLVASLKYTLVAGTHIYSSLLFRKIFFDALAAILALLATTILVTHYPETAVWGSLALFIPVSAYMFWLRPFYVL